jgi:hypothetical protein
MNERAKIKKRTPARADDAIASFQDSGIVRNRPSALTQVQRGHREALKLSPRAGIVYRFRAETKVRPSFPGHLFEHAEAAEFGMLAAQMPIGRSAIARVASKASAPPDVIGRVGRVPGVGR